MEKVSHASNICIITKNIVAQWYCMCSFYEENQSSISPPNSCNDIYIYIYKGKI